MSGKHVLRSGAGTRRYSRSRAKAAPPEEFFSFAFRSRVSSRAIAVASLVLALLPAGACRLDSHHELARRILDRYRLATGAKPLPPSHVIRMRLSTEIAGGGAGVAEIAWEPNRYRERISSAGITTERGIQAGKAYFTDDDGVTRVASEPVLRELLTRSYFWRRAWLFGDRERARLSLGEAAGEAVSVRLGPLAANPILLRFSRRDGRLLAARSPRFDLDFTGARAFRESDGRHPPVSAEVAWEGLPTGRLPDASVSGGRGRFAPAPAPVPFEWTSGGNVSFPARVGGIPLRLALDAAADGPLAVSRDVAKKLGLAFDRDVYGRSVARGAALETGGFSCRGIHVQALEAAPESADGVIGGTIFREAVVELDPEAGLLALHDPARWAPPAGFNRIVVDDDGNRPVAILKRRGEGARLLAGSPAGASDLLLAQETAERLGIRLPGTAVGLRWGPLALPDLSAARETRPASPAWGDDGRLGFAMLLRFHSHLDMPHRWIYLKPVERPRGAKR